MGDGVVGGCTTLFLRRAILPEGGAARVGGGLVTPLADGKEVVRALLSESESELTTNGSKEFVAGLRWGKDWAEDNIEPSTCEEWMGGEGWRTLLRRECP